MPIQIDVFGHTMSYDLPNENPFCLWALHRYCVQVRMWITADKIEAEYDRRPHRDQLIMQRLGFAKRVKEQLLFEK